MFLHKRVKQNWLVFQSLFVEKLRLNLLSNFFFFKKLRSLSTELVLN